METAILLGLVGIGYLSNNSNRDETHNELKPELNTPTHSTVYDQNNYQKSKEKEKSLANNIINKMKTDNTDIIDSTQTYNNQHVREYIKPQSNNNDEKEYVYSNSLSAYVDRSKFLTNDQGISSAPYFKGTQSPTLNLSENIGLQVHQGGQHANGYGNKQETPHFFKPTKENIYGNQFDGVKANQNRYIPGSKRQGELPFQQEKVPHIDEKSQLNREIDLAIAKTRSIDTLRTLTNQKYSYEGRIVPGKHLVTSRGQQADVDKNKPYRDYVNSPARYFTSATDVKGATHRPEEILPYTNRQFLNRTLLGPAGPQDGKSSDEKRPKIFRAMKQQLGSDTERNAGTTISGNKDYNDLGYVAYPNERDVTVEKTHTGIAGTTVNADVNRQAELNSDTNPTKEIIAQGREPTLNNVKLWIGGDDENMEIKKIESDYMTHHTTGLDKVYQEIPRDFACKYTRDKFELEDADQLIKQIDPELLNPFRENPFTKSLASYAYA